MGGGNREGEWADNNNLSPCPVSRVMFIIFPQCSMEIFYLTVGNIGITLIQLMERFPNNTTAEAWFLDAH